LDNQLFKNQGFTLRIALAVLAILLAIGLIFWGVYQYRLSDPYIRIVLSLKGDEVQGHAIFQMNCSGCHGLEADGRVGPSLKGVSERKSKVSLIYQVISGKTPPMPQFQPTPQEMADLLSYLESL
jgi:mono/diheme cytochrome c family protein